MIKSLVICVAGFVLSANVTFAGYDVSVNEPNANSSGVKLFEYGDKSYGNKLENGSIRFRTNLENSNVSCSSGSCLISMERSGFDRCFDVYAYENGKFLGTIRNNIVRNTKEYPANLDISDRFPLKRIQERSLSCETSATADILTAIIGKEITEYDVFDTLPKSMFNQLPYKNKSGNLIWGNPNAGFVGYVDKVGNKKATQSGLTGYGVLEEPISKVYKEYSLNTEIWNGNRRDYDEKHHLKTLLQSISDGYMVQLWGDWCTTPNEEDTNKRNYCKYLDNKRELVWYYEENGKLVKHIGLSGEHAFYLLGYVGTVDNPERIIVWDTATGKHSYSLKEWMRKWNRMQNRSIIASNNQ